MIGKTLTHYEIIAAIGRGGMGEVWRARDTKLGREVAIKTLPAEFAKDADRLARFEREAKLLASLNHPNIAAVHGFDEDDGTHFLVMELVDGDTLADRLRRGAIPIDEALELARQITNALEAAHESGVIHRDLKPANIKVTDDGKVKVLDFGLAKAFAGDDSDVDPANSPTLSMQATQQGVVLGTAAYMAPEQARGKTVDRRADIFAFGVVLYEMVTGRRLFQGEDLTETVASVVMKEPDFDEAPARLRRLLRKCLQKDPKNRLRDIGDVWELLEAPAAPANAQASAPSARTSARPWMGAAAVMGLAAIAFAVLWLEPDPLPEVMRFQIQAPPDSSLPLGTPAISNDGSTLAYTVIDPDGVRRLHTRGIDRVETRVLPGTEGAVHPFWSPNGNSLAFAAMVGASPYPLRRIDIAGGSPRDLTEVFGPWHGAWNQNDDILFVREAGSLGQVSAQGGAVTSVPGSVYPEFLSDGERYLTLVRLGSDTNSSIQMGRLGSTELTLVLDDVDSAPILAPTPAGKTYLLFLRAPDLMAQEFDQDSGTLLGSPVVLVGGIGSIAFPAVRPAVGVSPSGILAYQSGAGDGEIEFGQSTWLDRSGEVIRSLPVGAAVLQPRLSPDESSVLGIRIAGTGAPSVWQTDLTRESTSRLVFGDGFSMMPIWSPDGSRVAYAAPSGIMMVDVDSGDETQLLASLANPTSWSPDGDSLLYRDATSLTVMLLDLSEGAEPVRVGPPNGESSFGEFSPGGDYIAYVSDESGREDIYVRPVPPATGQMPVSINGGSRPRWRGDGQELYFLSPDSTIMAVDVEIGETVSFGIPRPLFQFTGDADYDVTDDGEEFFIFASGGNAQNSPITVVLNWWVELE